MQELQNSSVNGIAAELQISYWVAKPVYVDRDYVTYIKKKKKNKKCYSPFLPHESVIGGHKCVSKETRLIFRET